MARRAALVLTLAAALAGCALFGPESQDGGSYRYVALDSAGHTLVSGTLRLAYNETEDASYPLSITGTRNLDLEKDAEEIGPHTGRGALRGSISRDGRVWINLNPDFEDNNVVLMGSFDGDRFGDFSGEWVYAAFGGGINGGPFRATRR